jgi:hypothetical protein
MAKAVHLYFYSLMAKVYVLKLNCQNRIYYSTSEKGVQSSL